MTSEIINMAIGAVVAGLIGGAIQYWIFGAWERRQKLRDEADVKRDQRIETLKSVVIELKDTRVQQIADELKLAKEDNHQKHAGLHTKIESHAGQLHEKINRQSDVFITRRECVAQHENTAREIEAVRRSVDSARARFDEVATTVHESATITRLIAGQMNITLPERKKS